MDRFVHNMKRNEHQEKFTHSRKVLDQPDILKETEEQITEGVAGSLTALQQMMFQPVIKTERYANSQNGLYLKQLTKATDEQDLKFIKCEGLKKCVIVKKPKQE